MSSVTHVGHPFFLAAKSNRQLLRQFREAEDWFTSVRVCRYKDPAKRVFNRALITITIFTRLFTCYVFGVLSLYMLSELYLIMSAVFGGIQGLLRLASSCY